MGKSLRYLLGLGLAAGLLYGCGGGSGGSSDDGESPDTTVTFAGLTTQAQVTTDNAPAFTAAVLTNSIAGASPSAVIGVAARDDQAAAPKNPIYTGSSSRMYTGGSEGAANPLFTESSRVDIRSVLSAAATAITVDPITQNCADGGSITVEMSVDPDSSSFTGEVTFANCVEAGLTSNGTMALSGTLNPDTETINGLITLAFTSFTTKSQGSESTAAVDITLNGSMACELTTLPFAFGCTQNFDLRDNLGNETFRTEDLAVVLSTVTGGSAVAITGKFYHPDHGYIETITPTDLIWLAGDPWPSSGALRLLGADDSSARVTVIDSTQYMLEVDNDGDGVFESNAIEDWP
ncbi:hypothetical protein FKG94_16960 [Exilibacterium tricleocarpae]|uniref:Lipoprotein n=1 Tax=Exilibacterium tricleocarpae TaxID=2591008 RepID=A0A545T843_9GAMM|nr:hypothetical protein [Exilibacterium tricleocarpae]TQV73394.1 hypothetical protein FKG94_16960 [Exilibacterium tricleocarpae]